MISKFLTLTPKTTFRKAMETLLVEHPKRRPAVWIYRYFETINGKRIRRTKIVGTVREYPTEADAQHACEHLRMKANAESAQGRATIRDLIDRYCQEVQRAVSKRASGQQSQSGHRHPSSVAAEKYPFAL